MTRLWIAAFNSQHIDGYIAIHYISGFEGRATWVVANYNGWSDCFPFPATLGKVSLLKSPLTFVTSAGTKTTLNHPVNRTPDFFSLSTRQTSIIKFSSTQWASPSTGPSPPPSTLQNNSNQPSNAPAALCFPPFFPAAHDNNNTPRTPTSPRTATSSAANTESSHVDPPHPRLNRRRPRKKKHDESRRHGDGNE